LAIGQGAAWAQASIAVPRGYTVKVVASGLNGPEGVGFLRSGHVAVCEAIDVGSDASRLTLVQRNGRAETVASDPGVAWVGVAIDPQRGYFVSTLSGPNPPGIKLVTFDGQVSTFGSRSSGQFTGIVLDALTGDLYAAHVTSGSSIDRIEPDGTRSVLKAGVWPEGMTITDDRVLIAAIQRATAPPNGVSPPPNRIVAFDLNAGTETVLAENVGTLIGGIAVSKRGEILVSDHKDGRIRRLSPDGSGAYTLSVFASGFSTASARFPVGVRALSFNNLAFDPAGRLYVTDYAAGKLYVIEGRF
jgi:hypothetical protein